MSCTDEVSFGLVEGAITEDNPIGDSALAWKELNEEYDPDIGTALADLKRDFPQSKLNVEQKPEEWIRSLEKIQTKLKTHGHEITKDNMILHILSNLPEEYDNTIERLEESYGTKTLDLKTIKQSLKSKHKRITKYMEAKTGDETALFAKQFKGRCRNCGFNCGKKGHYKSECRSPPKDDTQNNQSMTAIEADEDAVLFMATTDNKTPRKQHMDWRHWRKLPYDK